MTFIIKDNWEERNISGTEALKRNLNFEIKIVQCSRVLRKKKKKYILGHVLRDLRVANKRKTNGKMMLNKDRLYVPINLRGNFSPIQQQRCKEITSSSRRNKGLEPLSLLSKSTLKSIPTWSRKRAFTYC